MSSPPDATPESRALGALLGALVGDAAGATLEFLGRGVEPADVERALGMQGGGVLGTAPGQITDDGELTLCLAQGLDDGPYEPERVATGYARWLDSGPFDVGIATGRALGARPLAGQSVAEAMRAGARANLTSKANGSVMRAVPLAIWGARRSPEEVAAAVHADATLSHPNPACRFAGVAYVLAIRHLLLRAGDVDGAVAAARASVEAPEAVEVSGWLEEALAGGDPGYAPNIGFVRLGFQHAFRHLAQGSTYEAALRETLAGGGDTDTNACIVGGLSGALHGVDGIPARMREAVLECDTARGRPRPDWLSSRQVPALVRRLLGGLA